MKQTYINLLFLAIVGLYILSLRLCNNSPTVSNTTTVHSYDTVWKNKLVTIPIELPKEKAVLYDTIWMKEQLLDTVLVLHDYFAQRYYNDTLTDDSTYWFNLEQWISENIIIRQNLSYQDLSPTIIHHSTQNLHTAKPSLYLGTQAGFGPKQNSFGPSLLFVPKKQWALSYSYDLLNNGHNIGLWWTPAH